MLNWFSFLLLLGIQAPIKTPIHSRAVVLIKEFCHPNKLPLPTTTFSLFPGNTTEVPGIWKKIQLSFQAEELNIQSLSLKKTFLAPCFSPLSQLTNKKTHFRFFKCWCKSTWFPFKTKALRKGFQRGGNQQMHQQITFYYNFSISVRTHINMGSTHLGCRKLFLIWNKWTQTVGIHGKMGTFYNFSEMLFTMFTFPEWSPSAVQQVKLVPPKYFLSCRF